MGLLEKADRRRPAARCGESALCKAGRIPRRFHLRRDALIRRVPLCGLHRRHRHHDRRRRDAGRHGRRKFLPSVLLQEHRRILAPLAHHARRMVQALRLLSAVGFKADARSFQGDAKARRRRFAAGTGVSGNDPRLGADRRVARQQPDVPRLGYSERRRDPAFRGAEAAVRAVSCKVPEAHRKRVLPRVHSDPHGAASVVAAHPRLLRNGAGGVLVLLFHVHDMELGRGLSRRRAVARADLYRLRDRGVRRARDVHAFHGAAEGRDPSAHLKTARSCCSGATASASTPRSSSTTGSEI